MAAPAPQGAPQGPQPNLQFVPAGPLGTPVTICEFLGKRYQVLARIGNDPAVIDAAARARLEQLVHTLCALHEAHINSAPPATPFRIDQMTADGMHDKDGITRRAHNFVIGNAMPQIAARPKQQMVTQCLTDEGIDVAGNNVAAVELWNRIAGHCARPVQLEPITNAQAAPQARQPQQTQAAPQPAQQPQPIVAQAQPAAQAPQQPQPAAQAQVVGRGGAERRTPRRSAQGDQEQPAMAAQAQPAAQAPQQPQPAAQAQVVGRGGAERRTPRRVAQREAAQPSAMPRTRLVLGDSDESGSRACTPGRSAQRGRAAPPMGAMPRRGSVVSSDSNEDGVSASRSMRRPAPVVKRAMPAPAPMARSPGLAAEADRAYVHAQRIEAAHEVIRRYYRRDITQVVQLRKEIQAKAEALPGFNQKSFDASCGQAMKGNDADAMAAAFARYLV